MSTEPTKGQTVYNTEGRSAIYVARVDDGHGFLLTSSPPETHLV